MSRRPPDQATAHSRASAQQARAHEEHLKARFDETQREIRERLATPIERATRFTKWTMALFAVRVWRHFLQHNGFLLAAGISYQALFAFFAAIYLAFTIVGLWLGGAAVGVAWLTDLINLYVPGLISSAGENGLISPEDVQEIVAASASALTITGLIALGTLAWTAIGWVTYSRRAVRDILGLPLDARGYILLKARDLVAALLFGLGMVVGGLLNNLGTYALTFVFQLLHLSTSSAWFLGSIRVLAIAIALALNTAVLAALFRFLAGVGLKGKRVRSGALLGGAAITVLQLGIGLLVLYTPSNPLLATFALFIGLLLWFRLIGIVTLVAASWIAVGAADRDLPLEAISERERLRVQHEELLQAARDRLRTALAERDATPWYRRLRANQAVRAAQTELLRVETSGPRPTATPGQDAASSSAGANSPEASRDVGGGH